MKIAKGAESLQLDFSKDVDVPRGAETQRPKTWKSTIKSVMCNITMEPALFLLVTGIAIQMISTQNLLIQKVCLDINKYSEEICNNIQDKKYSDEIDAVQKDVSYWKVAINLSQVIPSMFYSITIGAWADKHGRKPFLKIPLFGYTITTSMYIFLAHYLHSPVYLMIIPGFIGSLFGGYGFFVCCLSYMSDVSTKETRTIRFAIVEMCALIGAPIGIAIGGIMFKKFGYIGVYGLSASTIFVTLLYVTLLIPESKISTEKYTQWQKFRDLLRFSNFKDSFNAFNAKRGKKIQMIMILLLISAMVINFAREGSMKIKYLFAQKMFHWNLSTYSNFESVTLVVGLLLLVLFMGIVVQMLRTRDSIVGTIGTACILTSFGIFGFSFESWMFYVGSIVSLVGSGTTIVIRSKLTKVVSAKDIGKVLSFVTVCEQAMPIIADSACPVIYANTVDIYPGILFFISGFLSLVPFAFFLWLTTQDGNKSDERNPLIVNDGDADESDVTL